MEMMPRGIVSTKSHGVPHDRQGKPETMEMTNLEKRRGNRFRCWTLMEMMPRGIVSTKSHGVPHDRQTRLVIDRLGMLTK